MKEISTAAVIVAAGSGVRMGAKKNKLLLEIAGKPVLRRTLEVFDGCEIISGIIVVVPDFSVFKELFDGLNKIKKIVIGGESRALSVSNGIKAAEGYDFVAVHDGARALVTHDIIENTVNTALKTGAAVAGLSVTDTIKQADANGALVKTLERDTLFAAQTPQAFRRDWLLEAYENFEGTATDDAAVMEKLHTVAACRGSEENIKITTPFDLILAEAILEKRETSL